MAADVSVDPLDVLRASPFDDELRLVIADQLQRAGDPHGELAIVQRALRDAPSAALRAREADLIAQLLEDFEAAALDEASADQLLGLTWHLGWIRRARVQLAGRREGDVPALFDRLLATRSARLLEHLELRLQVPWRRDVILEDYLAKLIAHGPHPALRVLEVGNFIALRPGRTPVVTHDISAVYITNRHLASEDAVVGAVSRQCPSLEEIRLQGNVAQIGDLVLPHARVFEVHTSSLGKEALAGLAAATWPALERLVLWFGDGEYGYGDPCDPDEVARFVTGLATKCPRLRHLALANSPWADEILEELASAPPHDLLARLVGLDVSLGTLGLAGVAALIRLRPHLPSLATLDVTHNFLDRAALAQLVETYAGVTVYGGAREEPLPPAQRYCAVGE